jgi:hypothetical protein
MDPDTIITLDDGSKVTLGSLLQSRKELQETLELNTDLVKDLEEVGLLFQANVPQERRENAVRNILDNLGYDKQQIDEYLGATLQRMQEADEEPDEEPEEEDVEVEEVDLPEPEEAPDTSGGEQEDTMSQEQIKYTQALQQELEAQRAELHRMRVRELRENLNSQLDRALKNNPDFQKLLESARSTRGDEGVKQAESTLRSQLEQRALERMQSRRAAAGTFEDSWMSEEVDKAVEPVMGAFRSVIGDIDKLGRSPETATGLDAQEILRTKPVPAPEYKAGATLTDIESDVKSFASDTIKRALASSPADSAI